jgi:hypothetical protein
MLARLRHAARNRTCLLVGEDRKSSVLGQNDANEGLDDVHATAATRARLGRLVGCHGTIGRLRLVRGLHRCHRSDQLTDPLDGLGLGAAGQQTAVPYPVESVRQDMDQEPPDEADNPRLGHDVRV